MIFIKEKQCAGSFQTATDKGGKLAQIRIGHLRIIDHLILGISNFGQGKKAMESTGFEPLVMNTWDQVCDGLRQNRIQGAFMPIPMAMDLFDSGTNLRLLMFAHRSGSLLLRSRALENMTGLKGKTILISSELSVQNMLAHRFLSTLGLNFGPSGHSSGLTGRDVIEEIVPEWIMPQMLALDEDGDIGGCMASEPFGSLALEQGTAGLVCRSEDLWKDHPCCGFVLQNEIIDRYPHDVEELITLFFITAHRLECLGQDRLPTPMMAAIARFLGQKKPLARAAFYNSRISFAPAGLVPDPTPVDQIQSYMAGTMGVLPRTVDLTTFIHPVWAQKAVLEANLEN